MGFYKTEEYLDKLIEEEYAYIVINVGTTGADKLIGEVFIDTDWNNVFDEPVLQILATNENEFEDSNVDQWFLAEGGFNMNERGMPDFARRYELTPRQEKNLFTLYFTEFLEQAKKCPLELFEDLPEEFIDVMTELDYFKKYTTNELMEIYEITGNENFLPDVAKDLFLF